MGQIRYSSRFVEPIMDTQTIGTFFVGTPLQYIEIAPDYRQLSAVAVQFCMCRLISTTAPVGPSSGCQDPRAPSGTGRTEEIRGKELLLKT